MTITDGQAAALGRRAVAWKHWRWGTGAASIGNSLCVTSAPTFIDPAHPSEPFGLRSGFGLPDMRRPGTQGWALTLIAEHNHRRSMWDALADVHHRMGRGLSYPEALVEAMEACARITAPMPSPRECPACRARGSKRGLAMWEWMIADGMDKYLAARGLGWKVAPQMSPLAWPMMRPCRVCSVDGVPTGVEP